MSNPVQPPPYSITSSAGMILCLLVGFGLAGFALLAMSEANMGAVLMAGACFWGILARLAQAGQQHKERMRAAEAQGQGFAGVSHP